MKLFGFELYSQQNLNGAQDYRVSSCTLIIPIILITSQLLYLQAELKIPNSE